MIAISTSENGTEVGKLMTINPILGGVRVIPINLILPVDLSCMAVMFITPLLIYAHHSKVCIQLGRKLEKV